jgi:hypothetical protein
MNCPVSMDSGGMIYIPSFMKIDTGVQAMLRFQLRIVRNCEVGITDGGFMNDGFRCRNDLFRHSKVVGVTHIDAHRHTYSKLIL